jgi:hypothetical protein
LSQRQEPAAADQDSAAGAAEDFLVAASAAAAGERFKISAAEFNWLNTTPSIAVRDNF